MLLIIALYCAAPVIATDAPDAPDAIDAIDSTDNDTPITTTNSPSPSPSPKETASMFNAVDGVAAPGAVLAVVAILVGLALAIAGFKLFRAALFAIGFALGATLFACVADRVLAREALSWLAFGIGGLLGGALAATIYSAGLFLTGATAGALLAAMLHTSLAYQVYPSEPAAVLLVLTVAFGVVGGVLAQRVGKSAVIIATSLVGAALVVWGVGYFAGDYPSASDLEQYRTDGVETTTAPGSDDADGELAYDIPHVWWVYLGVTLVLALGGALLQSKITARGIEFPDSFAPRKSNAGVYDAHHDNDNGDCDGTATGASTTSTGAAIPPRRKVVVIARRRDFAVDSELEIHGRETRAAYSVV